MLAATAAIAGVLGFKLGNPRSAAADDHHPATGPAARFKVKADPDLKKNQSFWETPRTLILLAAALVAITGTLAGLAGYNFGQTASAPSMQVLQLPPGTTITVPSAPVPK